MATDFAGMNRMALRARCIELGITRGSKMTVSEMKERITAVETAIAAADEAAEMANSAPAVSQVWEATAAPQPQKRKVERNRPKQNGIVRPSAGGKCRAVWDALDDLRAEKGIPEIQDARQLASEKEWNRNNVTIEFYRWCRFNGFAKGKTRAKA